MKSNNHRLTIVFLLSIGIFTAFSNSIFAQVLPQVCSLRGTLGTAPLSGATGTLPNAISRLGSATATCSGVTPPNPFNSGAGSFKYNVHYLKNPTIFPICVPIRLVKTNVSITGSDLQVAVFQAPFVPSDITNPARFRGDAGVSTGAFGLSQSTSFSTVIPGNSSVALVVYNTVNNSNVEEAYNLDFCTRTYNYGGSALSIPDNNPVGVNAGVNVTGSGRIADLNFKFTTGTGVCDATIGNVESAVSHTFVGDLEFRLTNPIGYTQYFMTRRGGNRDNICSTLIDDDGNFPALSTITNQPGQFISGNFSPEPNNHFSRFNGQDAQGTWSLNVSDNTGQDTGFLRRFSLEIKTTPIRVPFDIDGDGKSDKTVFRPSNGVWYFDYSNSGNFYRNFGLNGDIPVPADYSGDGQMDFAVFRPSNNSWYISDSQSGVFTAKQFGTAGDLPIPGDFDGDKKADISVFRPSTGIWYRFNSGNQQFVAIQFGQNGDIPVIGDFDGDLRDDIALFRPSSGIWYRLNSLNSSFSAVQFGLAGDKVVPADYTGDGITDIAVWRPSTGFWYVLRSEDSNFYGYQFGASTDLPTPADYDGDGETDIAVFRSSNGNWYIQNSTNGFRVEQWGTLGDRPAQNSFVR
jgi:subtilisin-like proprotein convertase family protein